MVSLTQGVRCPVIRDTLTESAARRNVSEREESALRLTLADFAEQVLGVYARRRRRRGEAWRDA